MQILTLFPQAGGNFKFEQTDTRKQIQRPGKPNYWYLKCSFSGLVQSRRVKRAIRKVYEHGKVQGSKSVSNIDLASI